MAVIEINGVKAEIKDYKWTCEDKNLQEFLQKYSELVKHRRGYGYFSESAIDNWAAKYMADTLSGKVISYSKVEEIDYSKYPPDIIF